ncbi:GNAT family N-acetyltransferase [Streptomyces sp. WMMC500]|uniref:GNAT family N-acetyltransferase n=1 Tax=Streptomyces sp. WMMC500 TaxID=3015154 RepID=UPI00248AD5F2|nr:GNAT family N-acetyltransferase [Streptomyces sp. WMMC500]WBB63218.1 GNAT family N-acetyltransferase [Streptomyces sp. WMMC500]
MDFTVRPVRPEEYERAGELVAGAYLADGLLTFGEDDGYVHELRDVRRRATAERAEVLVAVDGDGRAEGGRLLGSVTFVTAGSPFAELSGAGEGEFRMLAVAREARGRGVGEALVRACLDRARELGARRMVLSSTPDMAPAHRLYGRLGFVRTPERDWYPLPDLPLWAFVADL